MKHILTFLFFGGIFLILFRVFLQIRFIVLLIKYKDIFAIFGSDRWLFLAPEFIPVKYLKNRITETHKTIEKSVAFFLLLVRGYKIYIVMYLILFILIFLIK